MEVYEERQPAPVQLQHCYGNAVDNRHNRSDCYRGYNETVEANIFIFIKKVTLTHTNIP